MSALLALFIPAFAAAGLFYLCLTVADMLLDVGVRFISER